MARVKLSWLRVAAILIAAVLVWWGRHGQEEAARSQPRDAPPSIEGLRPGAWVEIRGYVQRRIRDDRRPPRHQRFIVELAAGATLLVAHNIDLAPRVPVEVGDEVVVRGEYESNAQGGVIHWTHHDPDGRRPGGWIRHAGKEYR